MNIDIHSEFNHPATMFRHLSIYDKCYINWDFSIFLNLWEHYDTDHPNNTYFKFY